MQNREREVELAKRNATKAHMEEFQKAREEWKRAEKEKLDEENRRIAEFAKYQQKREESQQAERKALEAAKDKARTKVSECKTDIFVTQEVDTVASTTVRMVVAA